MPGLRKFLRGCFAYSALLYVLVAVKTLQSLFKESLLFDRMPQVDQESARLKLLAVSILVLHDFLYILPLLLAVVFGIAWWTLRNGRPSARRWAIAASIAMLVSAVPLLPAAYFMATYGYRSMATSVFMISAACIGLGIAGLFAFTKQENPTVALEIPPARISGDGTHKTLDALALFLQIGGVLAITSVYMRWGYENGLPIAHGLESWLQWAIALISVIVIHESARALVGTAVGMKVRAFVIGPFQWRVAEGRWTFRFQPSQFFAFSGAAGLVSPDPDSSRWEDVAMIAAGPFSNLITGAIAAAFAYSAPDRPWEPLWEYFALFATISLIVSVSNLIPLRPDALYSDGARIYQLFRGGPVAYYQRAVKSVTSTLVSPRRPRDFDIEAIRRASTHFTCGREALLLRLWAMSYYRDMDNLSGASGAFAEAERIYHESVPEIPANLFSAFVINAALLRQDAPAARQWWNKMQARKPEKFNGDRDCYVWMKPLLDSPPVEATIIVHQHEMKPPKAELLLAPAE